MKMEKPTYLAHNHKKIYGMFAAKPYHEGDVVWKFDGEILPHYLCDENSMRITEDFSLQYENSGSSECFINHSCDPNCFISFADGLPTLIALRNIPKDNELCYNYNTIHFRMIGDGFYCQCKSAKCKGMVRGYDFLTPAQQLELNLYISPYIMSLRGFIKGK